MKKIGFVLCLSLCYLSAAAQAPVEKSLLWEITGKNLPAPSYLFGTIHLICPADFEITDSLKQALSKTKQVALEVDMDDPGLMAAMTKTMFMADGKTLKTILPEADYTRLNKFYKDSVGMDIIAFDRAKPFVMMGPMFNRILACHPESYEMTLVGMATKQKSEIIGLETIEEQMAIFDTIPYIQQAKMLLSMIDSLPHAKKEFQDLVELYKKQDVAALYKLTMKSEFGMDGQDELMLFNRNKNWIAKIEKIVQQTPTLIAVGAAHLGGDKGVIALLRKEGYRLRPIMK